MSKIGSQWPPQSYEAMEVDSVTDSSFTSSTIVARGKRAGDASPYQQAILSGDGSPKVPPLRMSAAAGGPTMLQVEMIEKTDGGSDRAASTTVITPRIVRTPPASSTPRGTHTPRTGGGQRVEELAFGGLVTAQEEQQHIFQRTASDPTGTSSGNVAPTAVPHITDFASRDEVIQNIVVAEELRKESYLSVADLSRVLNDKLKGIHEQITTTTAGGAASPNVLRTKRPPQKHKSPRQDGSYKASGGVLMLSALEGHNKKLQEREIKTLNKRVKDLKQSNLDKEVKVAALTRSVEGASKRMMLLQQAQSESTGLAEAMEALQTTTKTRLAYLQQVLNRINQEQRLQRTRENNASIHRRNLSADDIKLKQKMIEEANVALSEVQDSLLRKRSELMHLQQQYEDYRQAQHQESQRQANQITRESMERERLAKHEVAKLREQLNKLRREQLELVKRNLRFGESNPLSKKPKQHDNQADGVEILEEAMAKLKATVINFGTDLKKLSSVSQQSEERQEHNFKVSHNEVKVSLSLCLPPNQAKQFNAAREAWPITIDVIHSSFPVHKLEQVHNALQVMVITWDALPMSAKRRLTTAKDVICNAELLHELALFVERARHQKWSAKVARQASSPNEGLHERRASSFARQRSFTGIAAAQPRQSVSQGRDASPLDSTFRRGSSLNTHLSGNRPSLSGGVGSPRYRRSQEPVFTDPQELVLQVPTTQVHEASGREPKVVFVGEPFDRSDSPRPRAQSLQPVVKKLDLKKSPPANERLD